MKSYFIEICRNLTVISFGFPLDISLASNMTFNYSLNRLSSLKEEKRLNNTHTHKNEENRK